jgi:hypothetical protein
VERVRLQLPRVWLRELSSLDIRPIAGTDGAWSVFWAPDSKSVYFSVKETLKQANVDTGSWRTVKDLSHLTQSGTWLKNGDLLLYFAVDDLLEFHPKDGGANKAAFGEGVRMAASHYGKKRHTLRGIRPKGRREPCVRGGLFCGFG